MTKKFVSIILVLAIALSMFAMTAFADEAEPAPASVTVSSMCPNCGYAGFMAHYEDRCEKYITTTCGTHSESHTHAVYREYAVYICDNCGYTEAYPNGGTYQICMHK